MGIQCPKIYLENALPVLIICSNTDEIIWLSDWRGPVNCFSITWMSVNKLRFFWVQLLYYTEATTAETLPPCYKKFVGTKQSSLQRRYLAVALEGSRTGSAMRTAQNRATCINCSRMTLVERAISIDVDDHGVQLGVLDLASSYRNLKTVTLWKGGFPRVLGFNKVRITCL